MIKLIGIRPWAKVIGLCVIVFSGIAAVFTTMYYFIPPAPQRTQVTYTLVGPPWQPFCRDTHVVICGTGALACEHPWHKLVLQGEDQGRLCYRFLCKCQVQP